MITLGKAIDLVGTTRPTMGKAIDSHVRAQILVEVTGKQRDRVYAYRKTRTLAAAGETASAAYVDGPPSSSSSRHASTSPS